MKGIASLLLLLLFSPATLADTVVYVALAAEKKIVLHRMNAADGKLTRIDETAMDGEPGALTTDTKKRFLFASLRAEGKLAAYRIDAKTGKLTHINTVPAGPDPAHLSTDKDGRHLFCAYYVAAKVTVHRIGKDGSLGAMPHQSIDTAEKAHAILLDPSNRFAFVPHTGPNAIFQFAFDAKLGELKPAKVAKLMTPGNTGPRHIVFHPSKNIAYVDNEQGGSVTAYQFDPKGGTLEPIQTISTLPVEFKGTNACAEIKIHLTGKFLYVSNRGHDSIACFKVDVQDGKLTSIGHAPTEKTPRSFDLDPEGRFLYAAGESSGKVAAYRINSQTGELKRFATYNAGRQPWWVLAVKLPEEEKKSNVQRRGDFTNARLQFEKRKTGHVAFIGGSITEMNGYRPLVCDFLTKRFAETKFTFTDAGISSTCSTTGAFRLTTDVLAKGPVDLFFIEFAVNDDQDAGHARRECIRGMEGILRQALAHNPNMDIVITYFVNPSMLKTIQDGKTPLTIGCHEEVARHYHVSTVDLAQEVADRIRGGTLTWKQYGGVHPDRPGNELCTSMIAQLLHSAWKEPLPRDAAAEPHRLPDQPVDTGHYGNGRFINPNKAILGKGWMLQTPDWQKLPGSCRERFRSIPLLCATEPGAGLTLAFEGKTVGAYLLAGPDAGVVEVSIDGGPFTKMELFHRFSGGLHYPRTVLFASDLKAGTHQLKLRIVNERSKDSSGTAVRIIQFVAN